MAYNYLEEKDLGDALSDSESYMRDFYAPIPELQRITRGKPGKIPKGKPRVTEGTLASIRRETPKQIIQQLPSGLCTIHGNDPLQNEINAILRDVLIPNANSGGTPYAKAKRAIKQTIDVGSAWAYVFYNRTGALWHADYRIKNYTDVLFEKGKVSEFDTNYMPVIEWMTEGDIKSLIYTESQRKLTTSEWDLKKLQALLDKGPSDKDQIAKTPEEKKANSANGYFKLVYFFQKGIDATFFVYAPSIKEVVRKWTTKDPRGIIPIHGLVPEDDDDNPLGEPLAAISAGKQNLLDFDLQMYQYGQAIQYSPPFKKWGSTPLQRIKLIPDNGIEMDGNPATDDFKVVDLGNNATANFANNYGLLKSQVQSEMGRRSDTSISSSSGNPDFSKTSAGVKQSQQVTDISNNDLRQTYEQWQGRVWETMLNIHFAESKGKKTIPYKTETIKRYNLGDKKEFNYDTELGPIELKIEASSSRATDSDSESTKLNALMETKAKYTDPDDKSMLMYNQIVRNTGVADPERLLYTDEEIAAAEQIRKLKLVVAQKVIEKQLQDIENPPAAPPEKPVLLGEKIAWSPDDLTTSERAQALAQVGVQADGSAADTLNAQTKATKIATQVDKHIHDTSLSMSDHIMKHTQLAPAPQVAIDQNAQTGDMVNVGQ